MWVSNAPSNVVANVAQEAPAAVMTTTAYYDASVEVASIRIRGGEVKYVIEGNGDFAIFADDSGIWAIDLEVKRWVREYSEVVDMFRRASVRVYGNVP
ncbi:hypothetical protein [Caldivirga sp. UBA161]|uniref:hypothetical protein n=1 Tax=Caldivirga sp. UBA161 TaxID=1915569 RepID=UPI0025B8E823|nr:hypothetical protein [Caldivirga sp. UBA161]